MDLTILLLAFLAAAFVIIFSRTGGG